MTGTTGGITLLARVAPAALSRPSSSRSTPLDYLRTFIVLLVIAHHSVIGYVVFGHFDSKNYLASSAPILDQQRWLPFDIFYLATEVFFMPLLFLLSGLHVWSSLSRHGPASFIGRRLLRLGLPFLAGILVLMPPAHYPSFLLGGGAPGLARYWWNTAAVGPRPNGPLWFIAVLLLFDIAAAALFTARADWSRLPAAWIGRHAARPSSIFAALLAASIVVYMPALLRFGPGYWLVVGPMLVQLSRIPLYALFFGVGIAIGRADGELVSADGALATHWKEWTLAAAICCAGFVSWSLSERFGASRLPLTAARAITSVVFASACCAMGFALLAVFLRFARKRTPLFDSLTASAYGIYLLHYLPLVWLQWTLLPADLPAVAKAALVLMGTLGASWGIVIAVRRIDLRQAECVVGVGLVQLHRKCRFGMVRLTSEFAAWRASMQITGRSRALRRR